MPPQNLCNSSTICCNLTGSTPDVCCGGDTCCPSGQALYPPTSTTVCAQCCASGSQQCDDTQNGTICCPTNQCLGTLQGNTTNLCCPSASDVACKTGYDAGNPNLYAYICCDATCLQTGTTSTTAPPDLCCPNTGDTACNVLGEGYSCCSSTNTCATQVPGGANTDPVQSCCPSSDVVCHTYQDIHAMGGYPNENYSCCSGQCLDTKTSGGLTGQDCCPAGNRACLSGAGAFYTDPATGNATFDVLNVCCPNGNPCVAAPGGGSPDPIKGQPVPNSLCCEDIGKSITACRAPWGMDPTTGQMGVGWFECCPSDQCKSYTFSKELTPTYNFTSATNICCASPTDVVCQVDSLKGEADCCSQTCKDAPTSWNGIPIHPYNIQTCCPASSSLYISSTGTPGGDPGPFEGYSPHFACCPAPNISMNTDDVTQPQLCCANNVVAGHAGSLTGPLGCCQATDSTNTLPYPDGFGRILTATLCCSSGTALPDEVGQNLSCCASDHIADGPNGPFCCGNVTSGVFPNRKCNAGGTQGPTQCGDMNYPACTGGVCDPGWVCSKDQGSPCQCVTIKPCVMSAPACGGTCPPGQTCYANNGFCYCG